jgi:hypothetical protein
LPADFEVFGQAVATSMADLLGGTTGQILAKNSATDMDFVWIANDQGDITGVTAGTGISGGGTSGTVTVTNSMATAIDAKGDLIGGTGADAFSRLAVGANGTVLTADSAEATGLKWATPASSGLTLILAQTIGTGVSSVNVTSAFSSTYDNYKILVSGGVGSADAQLALKLGSTTTGYYAFQISGSYSAATVTGGNYSNTANFAGAGIVTTASISGDFDLQNPNAAKNTHYKSAWAQSNTAGTANTVQGYLANATQYTDFTLTPGSGTLTGGTIRVYGYKNS